LGRFGWVGHVARTGEKRGTNRVLVGKSEGKRSPGRLRLRWEENNKMDTYIYTYISTKWNIGVWIG